MLLKKPALITAQTFLHQCIESGTWKNGDRLPTVVQLARSADVSATTMLKALEILKEQGTITYKRKSGIFLGKRVTTQLGGTKPVTQKTARWEEIKNRISADIIEGKIETGYFPSYKELANHYATGYGTLKKALQYMVTHKTIIPDKRSFRVCKSVFPKSNNAIILIQGTDFFSMLSESHFQSRFYAFLQNLEKECGQRNIVLKQHIHTGFSDPVENFTQALGFIVWVEKSLEQHLNTLVLFLERYQKPVIIFNQDFFDLSREIIHNKYTVFFGMGEERAGYAVGKHLLESGHTHICYIARTQEHWAEKRLQGIKNAYAVLGIDESRLTTLFFSDYEATKVLDNLLTSKDREIALFLQNEAKKLISMLHDAHNMILQDNDIKSYIHDKLHNMSTYIIWLRYAFFALFRKALTLPRTTAWICGDDYLAVYGALTFCKREYITIPRQLSVISFNNQIEAFHSKLTSYDFNMSALASKMLYVLFNPLKKKRQKEIEYEIVDGFIAQRDSTRIL